MKGPYHYKNANSITICEGIAEYKQKTGQVTSSETYPEIKHQPKPIEQKKKMFQQLLQPIGDKQDKYQFLAFFDEVMIQEFNQTSPPQSSSNKNININLVDSYWTQLLGQSHQRKSCLKQLEE